MSTKRRFTNLKIPILCETRPEDDATHMVIEGEPAVKFHTKNVKLGLPEIETPDKTKLPWGGGFSVLCLLTAKALVLLGFSIMHQ